MVLRELPQLLTHFELGIVARECTGVKRYVTARSPRRTILVVRDDGQVILYT